MNHPPTGDLGALDNAQKSAALAAGCCLVLAGPGSGKTRLLTAKARYLLSTDDHGALAAVSFTRDSAKELAARIGSNHGARLMAGTFHSLALKQCHSNKKILDEPGRNHYIFQVLERTGIDIPPAVAIAAIDKFKATLAPPPAEGEESEIYREYQSDLERHNLQDFQDILLHCVKGMKDGSVQPLAIKWLLVDEGQDMDEIQYEWVMAHVRAGTTVTLVADDDQSIYGWRHAMGYRGLVRFESAAKAKRYLLGKNYRCASQIVRSAGAVVEHNIDRYNKRIVAVRPESGEIQIQSYTTKEREAAVIALTLKREAKEWSILARTNFQLDAVENACREHGVRILRLGGKSFWQRPTAAAILSFVDDLVKNDLRSGVSRIATYVDGASQADLSAVHEGRPPSDSNGLAALLKLSAEWGKTAKHPDRANLTLKAVRMWADKYLSAKTMNIVAPALTHLRNLSGSLAQRIARVRDGQKKPTNTEGLPVLSSLHSAKGLEWENVWLMGCEDGVIPHIDSVIEEERRLFYVGLTRAKNAVVISHTLDKAVPSRFISELN